MKIITKEIPIEQIALNEGQIPGLPANPRYITDADFQKMLQSIREHPEMLQLNKTWVIPYEGAFVVFSGNTRYRACKELGHKKMTCEVVPENTPPENLKAYLVKGNTHYGKWDFEALANEWEFEDLNDWGVSIPNFPDEARHEQGKDQSDFNRTADTYLNGAIRQIVLYFDVDTHKTVLDQLAEIGDTYGIDDDNTAVFQKILEFYREKHS